MSYEPLVGTRHDDKAATLFALERGGERSGPMHVRAATEEPQPARLGREIVEERAQALLVLGAHGPHADRGAIAERDIDDLGREKGHHGVMATLATPSRWLAKRS